MNKFLFTKIQDIDEFRDWAFKNGVYWWVSSGSKIGEELGITDADIDEMHRYDLNYKVGKICDLLVRPQIPILAFMSIPICDLYWYMKKFKILNWTDVS